MGDSSQLQHGTVIKICSGDSLVLVSADKTVETKLTLAHVSAPLLAPHPSAPRAAGTPTTNERCAWEAWEYLRGTCIGRTIRFEVLSRVGDPAKSEEVVYGVVLVPADERPEHRQNGWNGQEHCQNDENIGYFIGSGKGTDVAAMMVAQGLLRVHSSATSARHQHLQNLETKARAAGRGLWNVGDKRQPTSLLYPSDFDVDEFCRRNLGKKITGIIMDFEDVVTFALVLGPKKMYATVALTGVKNPYILPDGQKDPTADRARGFCASQFLQREVVVYIEGREKRTVLAAMELQCDAVTRVAKSGCLAEYLLRKGVVRTDCVLRPTNRGMDRLLAAEGEARRAKLGTWLREPQVVSPTGNSSTPNSPAVTVSPNFVRMERSLRSSPIEEADITIPDVDGMSREDLIKTVYRQNTAAVHAKLRIQDEKVQLLELRLAVQMKEEQVYLAQIAFEERRRRAEQTDLLKSLGGLHGRGVMESLRDRWTSLVPRPSKFKNDYEAWKVLIAEHAMDLQAVVVDGEQMIPPDVFRDLRYIIMDLWDKCCKDIHRLHMFNNRVWVDGDRLGPVQGKVLVALCTMYGVDYTYIFNGVFKSSRKGITFGDIPVHTTAPTNDAPVSFLS